MKDFRYIEGIATLSLNRETCIGCGMCATVCPHGVFEISGRGKERKTGIVDFGACMECGACATNCPVEAVSVTPGVGCAAYIISTWKHKLFGSSGSPGCC